MQDKKKIYFLLALVIVCALAVEFFFAHPHFEMIWNTLPGADIAIGFAGAWILIFLAKKLIAVLFQRKEDYYDDGGDKDAQ